MTFLWMLAWFRSRALRKSDRVTRSGGSREGDGGGGSWWMDGAMRSDGSGARAHSKLMAYTYNMREPYTIDARRVFGGGVV